MKRIICVVLMVLMITGTAAHAEDSGDVVCLEHGYTPVTCFGSSLHKAELICMGCETQNENTQDCSICNGSGKIKCDHCNGKGKTTHTFECKVCWGKGYLVSYRYPCNTCNGKGELTSTNTCTWCNGTRYRSCDTTEKRTKCSSCNSIALKCNYCYDVNTPGQCPTCVPEAYSEFGYRNVMRSPEKHLGELFSVQGVIIDITKIDSWKTVLGVGSSGLAYDITLRCAENGIEYTYSISYIAPIDEEKLLRGDEVRLWGVFTSYSDDNVPHFSIYQAQLM